MKARLEAQGMRFNTPDPAAFRALFRQDGFYQRWRASFGDDAWAVLETYTGRLS